MKQIITALIVCLLLASCGGAMQGMVRGSGERVTMSYEQAMQHDNLNVTLPDGETFRGKVVRESRGNMRGTLFGDRGRTMSCRFHYADSSGFTSAGGVGLCETSDGRSIDVQW
jgi:hypothetical protein